MQKYSKYKDSGVKWLGEIPSHWEVVKSKYLWKESFAVSDSGREKLLSVSQYDGVTPTKSDSRSESLKGYKIVSKNDLVINIMLAWMGGLGVSKYEGIVSPAYCIYKLCNSSNPRFLHFLYKTPLYLAEFARRSSGVIPSRWRMYTDDFGQVLSLLPPRKEQDAIVSYLDSVTSKIDEAIAQQQKMIDLLNERKQIIINDAVTKGLDPKAKMKDSGMEWIGMIPEYWEVKPIKYFKSTEKNAFVDGPFGSNLKSEHYIENGDVYVIESGMVTTGKFKNKTFKTISLSHFRTIERSECKCGDVIIAKIGAKFGMAAELPDLGKKCVVSGNSLKLTINQKVMLNALFVYYMGLAKIRNGFIGLYQETAQPALSLSGLNNMLFPIPPEKEQMEIVSYLDTQTQIIDRAIANCNKQIALLQERKQIIINDVVTGKVKVV